MWPRDGASRARESVRFSATKSAPPPPLRGAAAGGGSPDSHLATRRPEVVLDGRMFTNRRFQVTIFQPIAAASARVMAALQAGLAIEFGQGAGEALEPQFLDPEEADFRWATRAIGSGSGREMWYTSV